MEFTKREEELIAKGLNLLEKSCFGADDLDGAPSCKELEALKQKFPQEYFSKDSVAEYY